LPPLHYLDNGSNFAIFRSDLAIALPFKVIL
jgi:hypothetical protein